MKVLVGVKRVLDYSLKVRPNAAKTSVELKGLKMSINPFCEIAVEEAIKMKEAKKAKEVVAVSIGDKTAAETIRTALAMGADRGIHVLTDMRIDSELQPLAVAKIFKHIYEKDAFDLVLLGKQSIDDDCNQTGQILAAMLDLPQATFASKIEFASDNELHVTREIDAGLQKVKVSLPAVVTCDLRLNVPRFAKIQDIIKAKKKPIDTINLSDLDVDVGSRLTTIKVDSPETRQGGVMVESVDDLLDKLRNEAKVL
jgi:electron transfer flavoprotein beta subunit